MPCILYFLLILSNLLGFRLPLMAEPQTDISTVDFKPREGWNIKSPLKVEPDGRMTLLQDGLGVAWKSVEMDVDEFPMMLAVVTNTLPRERWAITVERGELPTFDVKNEIILIKKFAEEGGFFFHLKKSTGWQGRVKFVISVTVEGHKGDRIVLDNLEAVRLTPASPGTPELCLPETGTALSPLALHFSWCQTTNAVGYDLQMSQQADFTEVKSIEVDPPYLADKLPYLPKDEEMLGPGNWYWRVRGRNIEGRPGDWSKTGEFTLKVPEVKRRPPELAISAAHPLLIFQSGGQSLVSNWESLPEDLKPRVLLRVEEIAPSAIEKVLSTAQKNNIPVLFQASGPHDYYGRTSSRIPLTEIERILKNYPTVKGIYICEQAFRASPEKNRIMMNYAERLIPLAAQYGKLVIWADGHWGRNLWIDVGLNRKLMEVIQEYRSYFVPLWKMNGSLTPLSVHNAIFGLWLSGACDNWGVQPERWYWYEAGFGKLNEQAWFKEGKTEEFPPTFYVQMALLGLSSGASVYSFEPAGDIWGEDGKPTEISQKVTFPFLREAIRQSWIPSREEVFRKICAVYVADEKDSAWSLDYGSLHYIYDGLYGIKHPFQMIPSRGDYHWLPILSKWTPSSVLKPFPVRLDGRRFLSGEEVRRYLREKCKISEGGEAWIAAFGDQAIVMNSRENRDEVQTFELFLKGKTRKISGCLGVNTYLMAQEIEDGLWL